MVITDSQQSVKQHYGYESFGMLTASDPEFENPYTYTSREYDKELGLYYYRARYYDPMEGRFISKDPIGFEGGDVNVYSYVKNRSIDLVDPSGHRSLAFGGYRGVGAEGSYNETECCQNGQRYKVTYWTGCVGVGLAARGMSADIDTPFSSKGKSSCTSTRTYLRHDIGAGVFVGRKLGVEWEFFKGLRGISADATGFVGEGVDVGVSWKICVDYVVKSEKLEGCCNND